MTVLRRAGGARQALPATAAAGSRSVEPSYSLVMVHTTADFGVV